MPQAYKMRRDRRPRIAGDSKGFVREGNIKLETAGGRVGDKKDLCCGGSWVPRRKNVNHLRAFKAGSSIS